jgi:hypothetical protein
MAHTTPDAKSAFHVISEMEGNLTQVRELAYAIQMAVEGSTQVPAEESGSLWRLANLIQERAEAVEKDRENCFSLLHGYAYPGGKAVQS